MPAGTFLGRYEIRFPLGAGGMGEIYLAWDTQLERTIALKIHAALGEKDQAFEWLEKAYEARTPDLRFLKVTQWMDSLRSDPRFADLLRRVGFAE